MKLADWLKTTGTSRVQFARSAGLSPASVTALCNDEQAWVSRQAAERICAATDGAVTPNDFLGIDIQKAISMSDTLRARMEAAIEAFAKGEIVVVTDDDDREDEGDLIVAAQFCTAEKMALIIRHTSGIVCAPLTAEHARKLRLNPMVTDNDAPYATAFTVSVDYRHGTTTGISADDRTATVRGLANPNAGAVDFVRPGHIFPLIAREGGVLMRSGHTEAAVDLCKLAGLEPVGVIGEMVNDDGTVMKGPRIAEFAAQHKLTRISVADLIAYRQAREKLVTRTAEFAAPTAVGEMHGISYVTPFESVNHIALVHGKIGDGQDVLVRLHRADPIGDVFTGGKAILASLERIKAEGRGVLVYLRDGTAGVPATAVGSEAQDTKSLRDAHWHEVGLGAQILKDLGVSSIRLIASRTRTYVGLAGFGIEITGTEHLDV
ncbi:3,4-dihydroxy-2-butanone-4-phosphate synthase [Ancylobacter sp. 6x-1]|uniref:3,4-dihydroxy-2-butanone 4-phosphate synthase n=1 Tax=Ancylobacter crimeensis TaxID=2579147 RepID=A0ABT0D7Q2_9HYPH|nr:3,4-dihydroxy-2-butanone-4-phosphate synthase [Ancylobacter crimeensis]MCK0195990.1 3,4-dihydroxy-2-butanone-4-phosphate synthase [Ancylobacter crimeensis]